MRATHMLLGFICLLTSTAVAQESYPLPDSLQPITPDNAAQIQELATVGGLLPGQLTWSPDGTTLAVGTSADVRLYDTANLEAPPLVIPDYGDIAFKTDDELLVNGQHWNTQTGSRMDESELPPTPTPVRRTNSVDVQVVETNGQITVELHKPDGTVVSLPIETIQYDYEFDRVVFSPDPAYAVLVLTSYPSGYPFPIVQLWNIAEEKFVADIPLSLEILEILAFHADGDLLVTALTTDAPYGGLFESVQIWDGRTGELVGPDRYGFFPVLFSPDGNLLACMTYDGIALWTDHQLGILEFDADGGSTEEYSPIIFNHNGTTITTHSAREVLVWEVNTEQIPAAPRFIMPTEEAISNIQYNADESLLVSVEANRIIEIWDAQTGERKNRLVASGYTYNVRFSPDERLLVTGEQGNRIALWDVQTGEKQLTLSHNAVLNSDWSQAAYWEYGSVHIVDINTGQDTELKVIPHYRGAVTAFSPLAERVFFTGINLRMVDLRSGEPIFTEPVGDIVPRVQFNASGDHFMIRATPGKYGEPQVFSVWETQKPQHVTRQFEISRGYGDLLLSPDGKYLSELNGACGGGGGGSHSLWDAATGDFLARGYWDDECGPYTRIFTPDTRWLIVGWQDQVRVLEVETAIEEAATNEHHLLESSVGIVFYSYLHRIEQLTLSPDGSRLAVSISFQPRVDTGKRPAPTYEINLFHFSDLISQEGIEVPLEMAIKIPDARTALFSPDNQWLLTDNGFWRAADGEKLADVSAKVAAFSPDGTVLATVGKDKVTLWEVAVLVHGNESPLATVDIRDVREVAFSPDGTLLYIQRAGDVRVWGIPAD